MESVATLTELAAKAINQKLIMHGVGWDFYEEILKEFEDSNALHFAYDNGVLEIETPTEIHESISDALLILITTICFGLKIGVRSCGSTTYRQRLKAKGVEPDKSLYIQNEAKIRGNFKFDLSVDPPPDVVIEVDITSPSLDKMPIYAALGVPEVWLYKGEAVKFLRLDAGEYQEVEFSIALPILSSAKATEFLNQGLVEDPAVWTQEVYKWAREKK